MKHNKLVRDRIPEIIRKECKIPVIRIASDKEYWTKLKEKLREEVEEFAKEENTEELADILEVFNAICAFKKFDKSELEILRKNDILLALKGEVSCAFTPKNKMGALHLRANVKNHWFLIALRNVFCISDEPAVFVPALISKR